MLLEQAPIQSTGFRNYGPVDAREGFEIRIRTPNYRGFRISLLDGVDVAVDGERFGYENNLFALNGQTFSLEELRAASDVRWELGDPATIIVPRPGGLEPGIHQVYVGCRVRYPYFPPKLQPHTMPWNRLLTIVLP
ncbi:MULTISPECIES: DUF6379 domain-containing protein [unclassified Novosphingobium]|uniref:C-glycoside deglycosidase beta subunit domain-containing protein n=1 Tax=unclassified Novosphingobium TaxID=2644732 RepID=UPI00146A78AD|nr:MULTISPECIES: DUF6379 domain-containing protein [unclassified Novosphingobium]NMN04684.1 hypothetical protein [Novosphingobium sp. SG919]NMN85323.1 hypothetical protein [Novosphingobium sp. SG916]